MLAGTFVARITYIQPDGEQTTLVVPDGATVMDGAVQNDVPGILAECGGNSACGTCQVYISDEWCTVLEPPSGLESSMLQQPPVEGMQLRLSCQIIVEPRLDGMAVVVPPAQR
jgi:2Fe-2S ferredoxin